LVLILGWFTLAEQKQKHLKRLLLFLIFTGFIFSAKGQNWAAPGAVWHYSFTNFGYDGYVKIIHTGDTVISGKTCDILQKTRFGYNYFNSVFDTVYLGEDFTYIQNDTVFYFRNNQFFILYDFNATVGDSWIVSGWNIPTPCTNNTDTVSVDSISNIIINSDTLKVLYVSPLYPADWTFGWWQNPFNRRVVEKIGCLAYMFPEPYCVTDLSEGGYFRCYSDSSGWSYQTGISPSCDFILGINEMENNFSFSISPNPSSGIFTISCSEKIEGIEIVNLLGEKVSSGSENQEIDLTKESKGIYFVRVWDGEGNYSVQKIIIE